MQQIKQPSFDEFSPRRVIGWFSNLSGHLTKQWWKILLVALAGGLLGLTLAYLKKPGFKAEITFAVDEQKEQNNRSSFSEFSEQLGLGSIDGGNVFSSIGNIQELIRSRVLIEKTLRKKVPTNPSFTFADFYIDSCGFREKWINRSAFPGFRFTKIPKDTAEVLFGNGLITNIYKTLLTENIKINSKGKNTSITSVTCESAHPVFSKYFVEALLSEVTTYYIESKTQRSRINLAIVQNRADSVQKAYMQALYGHASFQDRDINVVRQTFSVPGSKSQTDIQILRTAYIDLSRNVEAAKTSLMNNTPVIQLLDQPVFPLETIKKSPVRQFVMFFVLTLLVTLVVLAIRYFWKDLQRIEIITDEA